MRIRRFLPIVLGAVLLISSIPPLMQMIEAYDSWDLTRDGPTSWDARMELVAAALPPGITEVGYLESADLLPENSVRDGAEFYLSQYGLAPLVLKSGADHEWIVGNFGHSLEDARARSVLDQLLGSYSLKDLGFGIYLIHRVAS